MRGRQQRVRRESLKVEGLRVGLHEAQSATGSCDEEAVESWQGLHPPRGLAWTAILALMRTGREGNGLGTGSYERPEAVSVLES